jgi:hypothetical protein
MGEIRAILWMESNLCKAILQGAWLFGSFDLTGVVQRVMHIVLIAEGHCVRRRNKGTGRVTRMTKLIDNIEIVALTVALVFGIIATGEASPPVPPPPAGLNISLFADVEVEGDLEAEQSMTWTWMHDTAENGSSTLAHGNIAQYLDAGGRAAQILYSNEVSAIDGLIQFKDTFDATSDQEPNLKVNKDMGYVASEASLIATAKDRERVGLSIVANGDTAGLGDMPSLCPWAAGGWIPATNEFIAAGSSTSTTSFMISHTDSDVTATGPPSLNHKISAQGIGTASASMLVRLMEGDSMYDPVADEHFVDPAGAHSPGSPNLVSKTEYSENTAASGVIDKFDKVMHYHSTIPIYQMPEPWYLLQ